MTQDRRITDKLPGQPLQWDEPMPGGLAEGFRNMFDRINSPSAAPAAGQAGLAKLAKYHVSQFARVAPPAGDYYLAADVQDLLATFAAPEAAGGKQATDSLRALCAEMVKLHAERSAVLTIHMEELGRLLAAPVAAPASFFIALEQFKQSDQGAAAAQRFADAVLAAAPVAADTEQAKPGVPMEDSNARFAIDAAIMFGREGVNKPPSEDHWLHEYWMIGQQLAKLGETSAWDNVTPLATPADAGAGRQQAELLNEVADVLAEQNWRGDLQERLRDLAHMPTPGAPVTAEHMCATCKDTGIVYTGPIGDPPEQCEACFDQEPAGSPAPVTAEPAHADDIAWGHDLQLRLMSASQDVTEHDDARQVMAEAACCLAALTGRPVSQSMERAADAAETRDAKGGEQ